MRLAKGEYRSETDPEFKAIYAAARHFVTAYARCGIDEFFAESGRAFLSINSSDSPWPRVSKSDLRRRDPALYAYLEVIFTPPAADQLAA